MAAKKVPLGHDDQGRPIWAKGAHGRPVCGAKLRSREGVCQSEFRLPNGRCKASGHGGRSTGPPIRQDAKPETVRRRHRSLLYQRLKIADRADAAREDPDIKSHLENIAAIEALITAEAEGNFSPPGDLWVMAGELYDKGIKKQDKAAMVELGRILKSGLAANAVIERMVGLMEQQRRHIDSEAKREAQLQTTMSAREVEFIFEQLFAIVSEEVTDPKIRFAIGRRLSHLLGPEAQPAADGAG